MWHLLGGTFWGTFWAPFGTLFPSLWRPIRFIKGSDFRKNRGTAALFLRRRSTGKGCAFRLVPGEELGLEAVPMDGPVVEYDEELGIAVAVLDPDFFYGSVIPRAEIDDAGGRFPDHVAGGERVPCGDGEDAFGYDDLAFSDVVWSVVDMAVVELVASAAEPASQMSGQLEVRERDGQVVLGLGVELDRADELFGLVREGRATGLEDEPGEGTDGDERGPCPLVLVRHGTAPCFVPVAYLSGFPCLTTGRRASGRNGLRVSFRLSAGLGQPYGEGVEVRILGPRLDATYS